MPRTRKARKMRLGKDLKENRALLKMLYEAKPQTQRDVAGCCTKGMCNAFSEISSNVLKGNIALTPDQFAKLRRYAPDLAILAKKRTPLQKKKRIIQQGGFISALLGPVFKLLSPAIAPIVSSIAGAFTPGSNRN